MDKLRAVITWLLEVCLVILIFFFLPVVVLGFINFFKLVVFGEWTMSQFQDSLPALSIDPVKTFVLQAIYWGKSLFQRVSA